MLQAFDHPSIDSIATFLAESQLLPAPTVTAAAQAPTVAAPAPVTSSHPHPTAPAVPLASQLPSPQAPRTPATLIVASAFKAPGAASPSRVFSWQQDAAVPGASGDGSSAVPLARWDVDLVLPSHMPGELQARFGCFLEGIEAFDPESVGMTPAEALLVDPQQRLVMEAFGDVAAATTAAGLYTK